MAPPPKLRVDATHAAERNVEAEIAAYEASVEHCRIAYERYFAGLEKREPREARGRCEAMARALPDSAVRSSGLRFRMQTARQRWTTYAQHWARILRELENGTYRRDRARAERRFAAFPRPSRTEDVEELSASELQDEGSDDEEADHVTDVEELLRGPAARPSRARPPGTESATNPGTVALRPPSGPATLLDLATPGPASSEPVRTPPLQNEAYRGVYERYIGERLRLGDAKAAGLAYETVAARLHATEQELRSRYAGRKVEFEVVERDGKVVMKPVIK